MLLRDNLRDPPPPHTQTQTNIATTLKEMYEREL